MRIGLINWSGHKNLGDDAMAQVLLDFFPKAVNMGEHPTEADWYILGGGTLIAPLSQFMAMSPNPEKTIGISLGVSSNWNGEGVEYLKRFHRIYARDFFSREKLKQHGVDAVLSVDLLCALYKKTELVRKGTMANIMRAPESIVPTHQQDVVSALDTLLCDKNYKEWFAMSPDEDLATVTFAYVYTDAVQLLQKMLCTQVVYATRLHANVLAWVAGVPEIHPVAYDPKVDHFYQRVKHLTPQKAYGIIIGHLSDIYVDLHLGSDAYNTLKRGLGAPKEEPQSSDASQ